MSIFGDFCMGCVPPGCADGGHTMALQHLGSTLTHRHRHPVPASLGVYGWPVVFLLHCASQAALGGRFQSGFGKLRGRIEAMLLRH